MVEYWMVLVDAATVVFAGFAAAFSWDVYKRYRVLSGGIFLPVAFTLLILQRVSVLAIDLELFQDANFALRALNAAVFFLFSIAILYGLWLIKKGAEEFAKSDKQVMKAMAEFEKRRKKRMQSAAKRSAVKTR